MVYETHRADKQDRLEKQQITTQHHTHPYLIYENAMHTHTYAHSFTNTNR